MKNVFQLTRLNPFEGLCLTASDLADEQSYHRRNVQRHQYFLHGYGIVQGLQVELQQQKDRYVAIVQEGFGITKLGQGVHLQDTSAIPLEVPRQDGEYMLWLFHVEAPDDTEVRPVFDTHEVRPARTKEYAAARLHPLGEDPLDAVALCRIGVRLGRMVQVQLPVPRAGRQARAAESYLKPRLVEYIRLNKKILQSLFRTTLLRDLDLAALGFFSALVSAEFLLIEEGTADRVLYRAAGYLINYAHDFFNPLPSTIARIDQYKEFIRRVNAEVPGAEQSDEVWLKWFEKFERLLQPLNRITEELDKTVDAQR